MKIRVLAAISIDPPPCDHDVETPCPLRCAAAKVAWRERVAQQLHQAQTEPVRSVDRWAAGQK
jgi:hypothetical protein